MNPQEHRPMQESKQPDEGAGQGGIEGEQQDAGAGQGGSVGGQLNHVDSLNTIVTRLGELGENMNTDHKVAAEVMQIIQRLLARQRQAAKEEMQRTENEALEEELLTLEKLVQNLLKDVKVANRRYAFIQRVTTCQRDVIDGALTAIEEMRSESDERLTSSYMLAKLNTISAQLLDCFKDLNIG